MSLLSDILSHNQKFVADREYEAYRTDAFPDKRLVIVTCMDTRLVELLPRAMNFRNGDVKMIKNAGALVSHPFGSAMRSVLVAVYELHAEEVAVVGHYGCGMAGLSCGNILQKARQRGVSEDVLDTLRCAGIDLEKFLTGFEKPEDGVRQSVDVIRRHPLLPRGIPVHGMMMSPETGKLDVVDGAAEGGIV
jgi:carbonic anhydrase